MSKRGFNISDLNAKKAKLDNSVASSGGGNRGNHANTNSVEMKQNQYLQKPVLQPEKMIQQFLMNARTEARNYIPAELRQSNKPITKPYCEVEARLGIMKVLHSLPGRRIASTGPKKSGTTIIPAFDCTNLPTSMVSGVSRGTYVKTTSGGISEVSPISHALGCTLYEKLKLDLMEQEMVETVYTGYPNEGRCCFPGEHDHTANGSSRAPAVGKMESKQKLCTFDVTIPAANYDVRINLSSEKIMDPMVRGQPPAGWKSKRIKRRRSYSRHDKSIAWQIDVTEVTTISPNDNAHNKIDYEIEMELRDVVLLQLINETDDTKCYKMVGGIASQLWWILCQLNPLHDTLDVEEFLRDHPNKKAVQLAQAQCGVFLKYMNSNEPNYQNRSYESPISTPNNVPSPALTNVKFMGCMPVNFSRHNIDEIQRSRDNAYYLSEKTDGVRYLMVFTGDTVVLLDRKMSGKQIIPTSNPNDEPMTSIIDLIKPGTVFDGEVVMNRKNKNKPRPIFIVFDVLSISLTQPVLQLPFEQRKKHLMQASFRTPNANRDMFADPRTFVSSNTDALPLVRKNFVKRTELDSLLQHVVEERGLRTYRNGDLYNHLTDGIIFQPNLPYVCGTDVNLLKWKYIDTVTIDVELLQQHQIRHTNNNDDDDDRILHVGCLGEEQTRVDMTRYVKLPDSERLRLEADRFYENASGRIAEVGFDPETGEWYYLKMRSDKIAPNHISTVLGTLLELAESLTTEELRFRMSVPPGHRDTYRKEIRGMFKGLLEHQRKKLRATATPSAGAHPSHK